MAIGITPKKLHVVLKNHHRTNRTPGEEHMESPYTGFLHMPTTASTICGNDFGLAGSGLQKQM